jgi:hypothetical protein
MTMWHALARLLAVTFLVGFASAGMAAQPDKIFTLTMSSGVSSTITATLFNAAPPNANSSFNSARLFIESGGAGWLIESATSSTGTVTIGGDQRSLSITSMSPVKPQRSAIVTITLKAGTYACGDAAVWGAIPYTGSNLSGDIFVYTSGTQTPLQTLAMRTSTLNCDGQIDCSQPLALVSTGPGVTDAFRLAYNKDGSACKLVNYNFINDIANTNSVMLQWDTAAQPSAGFTYTVFWKPEWVNPGTGLPGTVTKVAWFEANGNLTTPVAGRACLTPFDPAPYGTLTAFIDGLATTTTIFVNVTATLPAVPFPITIDRERMLVTAVSGGTWTVDRGAGQTAITSHTTTYADSSPKRVMSNPLPLDAAGKQMQLCIADEGWTTVDPSLCPASGASNPPVACVQKSTKGKDLGDGFMINN